MKTLLTYSSLTGNTKKVAEAIFEVMPQGTELYPVDEAPAPEEYDFIVVGFWADRENADKKAQNYLQKIKGKKVALFGTLGADPDSNHALGTMENAKKLVSDNLIVGEFMCQGKIDPKLTERLKSLPSDHPHAMTPERMARHLEASKHPNETDFARAKEVFSKIIAEL